MSEPRDIIDLLTEDHRTIGQLARQLEDTEQPADIRDLYLKLVEDLAAHEAAEQVVVFPAVRASLPDVESEAHARLGEHEEINELLAEMQTLAPAGLAFRKRASALLLDLQRHFETEEESLFPRLRAALPADRLVAMAGAAADAKANAPAFPPAAAAHR